MSTFLCKNGVRKEYFLTPTFIIEPQKGERTHPVPSPFLLSPNRLGNVAHKGNLLSLILFRQLVSDFRRRKTALGA